VTAGGGRLLAELSASEGGENITFTVDQATAQHPQFHITPQSGWMNDPNGMFQLGALYHVFFQYNSDAGIYSCACKPLAQLYCMQQDLPSTACWSCLICSENSKHDMGFSVCARPNFGCCAAIWGPPSWGHVVSSDLAHWQWLPIALEPDTTYDNNGVFSGSATVVNGTPILLYTGDYHCCISVLGCSSCNWQCQLYAVLIKHMPTMFRKQKLDCSQHTVLLPDAPPSSAVRDCQPRVCCS